MASFAPTLGEPAVSGFSDAAGVRGAPDAVIAIANAQEPSPWTISLPPPVSLTTSALTASGCIASEGPRDDPDLL